MKFISHDYIEVPAVTKQLMKEIDRIATEKNGPYLYQMMENAGRSLCMLTIEKLGINWNRSNIVVLAGSGGNEGHDAEALNHSTFSRIVTRFF